MTTRPSTTYLRLSDAELKSMAEGCTELTCLHHGHINAERRRREVEARALRGDA